MTGPQSGSPLAPFTADWVGGDISGLRALAVTLHDCAAEINEITATLNQQVAQLTGGDQGWQGPAAAAFTAAWRRDSVTAEGLAAVIGQTAIIIDGLAAELAMIENALEEQAHAASRYGVRIGTDGRPPPVFAGPPGAAASAAASAAANAAANEQHWVLAYQQAHEQAMADAQQARWQAASHLMGLYARIEPPRQAPGSAESGHPTIGQLLAGLWAAPTADRRPVDALIRKLDLRMRNLRGQIADAKPAPPGSVDELLDTRLSDVTGLVTGQAGPAAEATARRGTG